MNKKIEEIIKLRLQEDDYSTSLSFEERQDFRERLVDSLPTKTLILPEPEIKKTDFGDWVITVEKNEKTQGSEKGYIENIIKITDIKNNLIVAKMGLVHICDKYWNSLKMNSNNPVENLYGLFFNDKDSSSLKLLYKIKYLEVSEEEIQKLAKNHFLSGINYQSSEYEYLKNNIIPLEIIYSKLEKEIHRKTDFKNIISTKEHSVGKPWIDMVHIYLKDIKLNEHYNSFSFLNKKSNDEEINQKDLEKIVKNYKKLLTENFENAIEDILQILLEKSLEYSKLNNYDLYLSNSLYGYDTQLKNIFENHKNVMKEKGLNDKNNNPRLFIKSKKEDIIQKQKKIIKNRIKN